MSAKAGDIFSARPCGRHWHVLGRVPFLLLCCLVVLSAQAGGEIKDTITVDGVPLQLNLDLREGATENAGAVGRGKRMNGWRPIPFLALAPGLGAWTEDVAGVPVGRLAGRPVTERVGLETGLTWSTDRLNFRVVAAGGAEQIRTADLTTLEDSAVAIMADGVGGIEQHIVQTYELGQELDTLSLATHRRWVQSVGLGLRIGSQDRNRTGWRVWAGAGLRWSKLDRMVQEVERLPSAGLPERETVQGDQRQDWVPLANLGWTLSVVVERQWSAAWSAHIGTAWCSGPRGRAGLCVALVRHFRR